MNVKHHDHRKVLL